MHLSGNHVNRKGEKVPGWYWWSVPPSLPIVPVYQSPARRYNRIWPSGRCRSSLPAGHKIDFHLCLKTFIVAFIIRVGSIVISPSPIQAGERIEIEIVIQAVFVLRKQMVPTDSQQIEADRRHISVKRDIGRRKKRIVPIGAI